MSGVSGKACATYIPIQIQEFKQCQTVFGFLHLLFEQGRSLAPCFTHVYKTVVVSFGQVTLNG